MHDEYYEYVKKDRSGYFVFDGHASDEYGIALTKLDETMPALGYEMEHIPGRNGDIIVGAESYQNVNVSYRCTIMEDAEKNLRSLSGLLMTPTTYKRLEESYNPDVFRMAVCNTPITPEMFKKRTGANFDVTFTCKPQKYLKIGEMEQLKRSSRSDVFDDNFVIYNPTDYDSFPLLRFNTTEQYYPASTNWYVMTVNGINIKFRTITNDFDYDYVLDCETGETYGINKSTNEIFNINKFVKPIKKVPCFKKGENVIHIRKEISVTSNIPVFTMYVKGRWWTL